MFVRIRPLEPTPKDTIFRDGQAQLYRFRDPEGLAPGEKPVVLLVPSLINRWYILDLRKGSSLAQAFVEGGFDTYCLDWGVPEDEDRYLTWQDVLTRLGRVHRYVRRTTRRSKVALLGYCIGGTLSGIYSALHPEGVSALINLAGPFDFSQAGLLGTLVDPRWFDVEAMTDAGNLGAQQMQSGFVTLRPTAQISKWITYFERYNDSKAREAFEALESWASDNIPFPAAAYRTYITELYQRNKLIQGQHHVGGKRVDLSLIGCPVLSVVAQKDTICPPGAATALNEWVRSQEKSVLSVPGGHVGAVVGGKASTVLYPAMISWLQGKSCN